MWLYSLIQNLTKFFLDENDPMKYWYIWQWNLKLSDIANILFTITQIR